jgi:hypothetical protein
MACPSTRDALDTAPANISAATPINDASCEKSPGLTGSEASAAIFAGALAVLIEANRDLTVADHFFITAMTATRVQPASWLWRENGFGLGFSRRVGFGRLNLGKAVALAREWQSVGSITNFSILLPKQNVVLEANVTRELNLTFRNDSAKAVVSILLAVELRSLTFSSFVAILRSPSGTLSELKFLTTPQAWMTAGTIELPSYEFLGENPLGDWTVIFPDLDRSARGVVLSVRLDVFATARAPDSGLIHQVAGRNPYEPINNSRGLNVSFVSELVYMVAGKNFTAGITVPSELTKCLTRCYIASPDHTRRLNIPHNITDNNTTLTIEYVPSVFVNQTAMNLVIESLQSEECGFTAWVPVNYTSHYSEPKLIEPIETHVSGHQKDLVVKWALQLRDIIDDGYSTSAIFTTVLPASDGILRRQIVHNTGISVFQDAVPSTEAFTLEVGPSSWFTRLNFTLVGNDLVVDIDPGTVVDPTEPFQIQVFIIIVISLVCLFLCILWKFVRPLMGKRRDHNAEGRQISGVESPMLSSDVASLQ